MSPEDDVINLRNLQRSPGESRGISGVGTSLRAEADREVPGGQWSGSDQQGTSLRGAAHRDQMFSAGQTQTSICYFNSCDFEIFTGLSLID